jgi:hypothetical protein
MNFKKDWNHTKETGSNLLSLGVEITPRKTWCLLTTLSPEVGRWHRNPCPCLFLPCALWFLFSFVCTVPGGNYNWNLEIRLHWWVTVTFTACPPTLPFWCSGLAEWRCSVVHSEALLSFPFILRNPPELRELGLLVRVPESVLGNLIVFPTLILGWRSHSFPWHLILSSHPPEYLFSQEPPGTRPS